MINHIEEIEKKICLKREDIKNTYFLLTKVGHAQVLSP